MSGTIFSRTAAVWSHLYNALGLMLLFLNVAFGKNDNNSTGMFIKCTWNKNEQLMQCNSPYLIATIFLFLLLFIVIICQCFFLIRFALVQNRKEKLMSTTDVYSNISNDEFIASMTAKMERNDSIGSSSLNFLSPDCMTSVNSLNNISSLGDRQLEKSPFPKPMRQQTYCEIETMKDTVSSLYRPKSSISSSNQSTHYTFIKPLSLSDEEDDRPRTYFEIPMSNKYKLEKQRRRERDSDFLGWRDSFQPVGIKAEMHSLPEQRETRISLEQKDTLSLSAEEENMTKQERPATYIDVFADEDDFNEYRAKLKSIEDDDSTCSNEEQVFINHEDDIKKEKGETDSEIVRDRIPTYLSFKGSCSESEDVAIEVTSDPPEEIIGVDHVGSLLRKIHTVCSNSNWMNETDYGLSNNKGNRSIDKLEIEATVATRDEKIFIEVK